MKGEFEILEAYVRVERICASIWRRTILTSDGYEHVTRTISLSCLYRDREGELQSVKSVGADDVPKAILALQKAHEYLIKTSCSRSPDTGRR